jgi:uncharacterized membrane protein
MPKDFFTEEQKQIILQAVKDAEKNTSGEIRVHIEDKVEGDILDRASYIFSKLDMHKTKERNGVLFLLAYKSQKFAVIGDAGINSLVREDFWDDIKNVMADFFIQNQFTEGLSTGIKMAGDALKQHFPYAEDDINELQDDISFGNNLQ